MRRLYCTLRSPYARKVQLVLLHKGLDVELVVEDLARRSEAFVRVTPHGKVPVLVEDDGTVVCDSTVICEYLEDRHPTPPARGDGWQARLAVRELEELGDSLADQAIATFFGRQEGNVARAEKAERVATRLLETLEQKAATAPGPDLLGAWTYADAAVLSALGYWTLRLGDAWRADHPALAAWYDRADATPHGVATRPRLP